MKITAQFCLCALIAMFSGCITGRPQVLPKIDIICSVKDSTTQKPIKNASVKVVYLCFHTAREMVFEGFITDENGVCRVSVPEKHVWLDINEAYGGGFRRRIDVTARGYYEGGVDEGFKFGSEMNVGEITILLQQNWIEMSEILRTQDGPNHTAEPASLGRGGSS